MRDSAKQRAYGLGAGDRIGPYECVSPLAMGGMAEVYLARRRGAAGFEKLVVIKRVLPHLSVDTEFVDMFLKEARLASALDHPAIAQVIDFGHDGSDYYMVLEYVQGHDLRSVIKAGVTAQDALPLDMAVGIAVEAAAALHHAHEQADPRGRALGIVHRDVSPSNILLAHTGAVKVIDFGIARAAGVSRTTRAGVIKGKVGYMSPEQCRDEAVDRRTDVFSLGIVLYEMTTGYRLFHASSDFAAMNKIAQGRFTPPSEAVPGYPEALEAIVLRCLAPEPADRYESCDALRVQLEAFAMEQRLVLSAANRAALLERWLGPAAPPPQVAPPLAVPRHSELPPTKVDIGVADTGPPPSETAQTIALPPSTPPPAPRASTRRSVLLVAVTAGITGLTVWGLGAAGDAPQAASTPPGASPAAAPALNDSGDVQVSAPAMAQPDAAPPSAEVPAPPDTEMTEPAAGDAAETTASTQVDPVEPDPPKPRGKSSRGSRRPASRTTPSKSSQSSSGKRKTLLPPSMRGDP